MPIFYQTSFKSRAAQWKYNSSHKCNVSFPSSHIFQKQEETGEINVTNIFSLTQDVQNSISKVMNIKLINKIVYITFLH